MMNIEVTRYRMNRICNKLFFTLNNPQYYIFKNGSKTYFYSSLLFPRKTRDEISILYGFVRVADNFVDAVPQQTKQFNQFNILLNKALQGKKTSVKVIDDFIELAKKRDLESSWIKAFMKSMQLDTHKKAYKNFTELEEYMYGSAEVIGLIISKILKLDQASLVYAKQLGKSMQFINFIRDIEEDNVLGRTYIPQSELKKYNLLDLKYQTTIKQKAQFIKLMRNQIKRYFQWQKNAEIGFSYLQPKQLIAIKTASDLYKWTAIQIYNDPFIVYRKKVKPPMHTIITLGSINLLNTYL